ncbi:MAG: hypothetical protein R3E39_12420 [Anaerolineae bacterium]
MVFDTQLNYQSVLDGMGQAILIFDHEDRLVMDNLAARSLLGSDLKLIRASGWTAAAALFNTRTTATDTVDLARKKAVESARPIRFRIYRSGEYVPCWASAVHSTGGDIFTMITIEQPDWTALSDLMNTSKMKWSMRRQCHHGGIPSWLHRRSNLLRRANDRAACKRVAGFVTLITTHMHRQERLMKLFARLEAIRTGKLAERFANERRKIQLADFA